MPLPVADFLCMRFRDLHHLCFRYLLLSHLLFYRRTRPGCWPLQRPIDVILPWIPDLLIDTTLQSSYEWFRSTFATASSSKFQLVEPVMEDEGSYFSQDYKVDMDGKSIYSREIF
ncbi:hypothetical protein V2J09_017998 [Rumex salicifolius]